MWLKALGAGAILIHFPRPHLAWHRGPSHSCISKAKRGTKFLSAVKRKILAFSVGPAQEHAAGGVTGANGSDQDEVTFAQTALRDGVAQAQGNRAGSGVAVLVDVDHDLGIVHAESLLGGADDAQIGLVRH